MSCPVNPIVCPPVQVVNHLFYPQVIPVIHPIEIVNECHPVPIYNHQFPVSVTNGPSCQVSARRKKSRRR